MPCVLDTSALMALLRGEPGQPVVISALRTPGNTCYAHEVNLCEVFYSRARQAGEDIARPEVEYLLTTARVVPFANPDREFVWEVGRLRARVTSERLAASLADCFCLAAARHFGGELLTADHREFEPVAAMGLCQVTFIR